VASKVVMVRRPRFAAVSNHANPYFLALSAACGWLLEQRASFETRYALLRMTTFVGCKASRGLFDADHSGDHGDNRGQERQLVGRAPEFFRVLVGPIGHGLL
jgi:hypothetical protein